MRRRLAFCRVCGLRWSAWREVRGLRPGGRIPWARYRSGPVRLISRGLFEWQNDATL